MPAQSNPEGDQSPGGERDSESAPGPTPPGRVRLFLGHHWWQGIAAIAGVAAIFVPLIVSGEDEKPASGASPSQRPAPSVAIQGDCNAQGHGNHVNCVFPPAAKSLGRVFLDWSGSVSFLFAGGVGELPVPPDYPASQATGHCEEWGDWLSRQPKVYTILPSVTMGLLSGEPDLVVVRKIEAQVFERRQITGKQPVVDIRCQYGADGADLGHNVTVDTRNNSTELIDLESGDVAPLPPASLSLSGRGYKTVKIDIVSRQGFLYKGMIAITAIINGKEQQISLGSPGRPFKWLGGDQDHLDPLAIRAPGYDWSTRSRRWVPVLNNPPDF